MRPLVLPLTVSLVSMLTRAVDGEPLRSGIAKIEITDRQAGKVNDPCFAKALVLQAGKTTAVLVTVDAVANGEIGRIRKDFLAKMRRELAKDPQLADAHLIVNASHRHGIVRADTDELVAQRSNTGYAQEDCGCLVAPEWQRIFKTVALEMLRKL